MRKRALATVSTLSPKKRGIDQETSTETNQDIQKDIEIAKLREEILQLKKKNALNLLALKQTQAALTTLKRARYVASFKKAFPCKTTRRTLNQDIKDILSKCFTPGQIRCLLQDKRVKWSSEDIANALTLRALSKKTYNYLRKRNFPLPARSTLQKWTRQFKCRRGILQEVLSLMKAKATNFTELERICVLSFDEMNIDGRVCYDSSDDVILGPHSNVQVVMIRGLFAKWKQPIYYDFDVTMTDVYKRQIL